MNLKRIKHLKSVLVKNPQSVVYVMSRDQRVEDNFALLYAKEVADEHRLPLVVVFDLYSSVKNRTLNQYEWMLIGLQQVASKLKTLNIQFYLTQDVSAVELSVLIQQSFNPQSIFFDFSPLKGPTHFKNAFIKTATSNCILVDTHNIVPVWVASSKEEFGAYTLRPKLKKLYKEFLDENTILTESKYTADFKVSNKFKAEVNVDYLLSYIKAEYINNYTPVVMPGESSATVVLEEFIANKLTNYFNLRNDPTQNYQSNLSAYLHFGNISSFTIANRIIKYCSERNIDLEFGYKEEISDFNSLPENRKLKLSAEAFLEELIVRKELADNYCYYNPNYDSINGIKDWAKKSLSEHISDNRELYNIKTLETATTKDVAWNAAQKQLITTGKIHGYMRMYWAKKVLEWTKNPEQAVEFLISLNDKYHLDGYDPNGYVGILWSIGGLHDRAWFDRPIFGKIRYMNANGLAKKFALKEYISKWS